MIYHEFSHPFVNPLTQRFWDSVKGDSARYAAIPEYARKNVCGDWQECINEFVIRAVTTELSFRDSKESGAEAYALEKARGVSELDRLLVRVRGYLADRGHYPTFESFYPRILEVFTTEAK